MEFSLPTAIAGPGAAPELEFEVTGGGPLEYAAAPTLRFGLRIATVRGPEQIRSVALNVMVRIAATRRGYDAAEQERLYHLFGRPSEWGRTLRTLQWANMSLNVAPFTGATEVELPIACTYDLDVTASRYFDGLEDGVVPLEFLFSGTVFYPDASGRLQVGRVGWDKEATHSLPVAEWRRMIDQHFPDSAWLRLRREQFDALNAFKSRRSLMTWEATVDALLAEVDEP